MVEKYDIKSDYKMLYTPSRKAFERVDVPELRYIAIDGAGDPNTSEAYADAVQSLYAVAYALKFASKKGLGRDFTVGPLEGLWRADDMAAFVERDKSSWRWTMMIAQPDWISSEMVEAAKEEAFKKKRIEAIAQVRFLTLVEGPSIQILHLGSYDDEAPTLRRLHHDYMPANGLTFNGDHHEIYLSDPRKTPPERLKTILRQPVRSV